MSQELPLEHARKVTRGHDMHGFLRWVPTCATRFHTIWPRNGVDASIVFETP